MENNKPVIDAGKIIAQATPKKYVQYKGTSFPEGTPDLVREILAVNVGSDERLRLYYGDRETGECWMDEYDTIGTIGRSTGNVELPIRERQRIPLLLKTSHSLGGGAILVDSIVRIDEVSTHRVLYKHPNFHFKEVTVDGKDVFIAGEHYASMKTEQSAIRLADFLLGRRYAK